MKLIEIKSQAQREMLEKCAGDPKEAARRGMMADFAQRCLDAHVAPRRLPERLGVHRPNRHGRP